MTRGVPRRNRARRPRPAKLLEAVQAAARRKGGMAIFCNSHTEVEKVAQGLQGLTVVQVHEHANEDETQERLNALDGTWAIVAWDPAVLATGMTKEFS
ncbi:unnamed protein product [Effrenium voratum]|nr:unnamed protein product [Effrenium voratum]